MKTFRYPLGHKYGETMTVGEMKELLGKYEDSMPVLAAWEGILTFFEPCYVQVETPDHWHHEDIEPCLVFEVDQR
jgi:hypothetical protein